MGSLLSSDGSLDFPVHPWVSISGHGHLCWNSSLHSVLYGGGKAVPHGVNVIKYRLFESVTKVGDVLLYATNICSFPEVNLSALWFRSMCCQVRKSISHDILPLGFDLDM